MNLVQIIKDAQDIGGMVAAGVGVLALTNEATGPEKKAALTAAVKTVAADFGLTFGDKFISIAIEVVYVLGKLKGLLANSGAPSPAPGGTASKTS